MNERYGAAERRIGAYGGVDQRGEATQDAVLVEAAHGCQLRFDLRAQLLLARLVGLVAEARAEQLDKRTGGLWMRGEDVVLVSRRERRGNDAAVAAIGAQDHDVVVAQARAHDQRVERVRLDAAAPDRGDGIGDSLAVALAGELGVVDEHAEVVQVGAVVTAVEAGRHLFHDRQAESLEDREELAQRDLASRRRDGDPRERPRAHLRMRGQLVLEADGEFLAGGDTLQQGDVGEREVGRRCGLVVAGQPRRVEHREAPSLGVAVARRELVGEAVVPGAREPGDLLLELAQRHVGRLPAGMCRRKKSCAAASSTSARWYSTDSAWKR